MTTTLPLTDTAVVRAETIGKRYGSGDGTVRALDDVTLSIARGGSVTSRPRLPLRTIGIIYSRM